MRLFILILTFLGCATTKTQRAPANTQDNIPEFKIQAPFAQMRESHDKENKFEGQLSSANGTVNTENWFKGIGRRELCEFPGMRVDVKKAKDPATVEILNRMGLADWKDFQLITHCGRRTADLLPQIQDFEQYMLRECFVYKFAELIGVPYFRTKIARITYTDSSNGRTETHFACFLETKNNVAKRMGGSKVYIDKENQAGVVDDHAMNSPPRAQQIIEEKEQFLAVLVEAFSGNGDWGMLYHRGPTLPHPLQNFILIPKNRNSSEPIENFAEAKRYKYWAVPHDFNLSSLVGLKEGSQYLEVGNVPESYPDVENFDRMELRYILLGLHKFSAAVIRNGLAYIGANDLQQRVLNAAAEFPFDRASHELVNRRLAEFFFQLKPENFNRPRIKDGAPIFKTAADTKAICHYVSDDIVTFGQKQGNRTEATLHSLKEETVFCREEVDVNVLNEKVWVNNASITTN